MAYWRDLIYFLGGEILVEINAHSFGQVWTTVKSYLWTQRNAQAVRSELHISRINIFSFPLFWAHSPCTRFTTEALNTELLVCTGQQTKKLVNDHLDKNVFIQLTKCWYIYQQKMVKVKKIIEQQVDSGLSFALPSNPGCCVHACHDSSQ